MRVMDIPVGEAQASEMSLDMGCSEWHDVPNGKSLSARVTEFGSPHVGELMR